MQATSDEPTTAAATRVSPPLMLSKARRRIAKLEERQQNLDAARARAIKELADEERKEAIASGQTEFLTVLETLDLTTQEMVVSTVLQGTKDPARRNKIQAWIAMIPKMEPRKNGTGAHGETENNVSSDLPPNSGSESSA